MNTSKTLTRRHGGPLVKVIIKDCDVCKKSFRATGRNQKRCSRICYRLNKNKFGDGRIVVCDMCGVSFSTSSANKKRCGSASCSREYHRRFAAIESLKTWTPVKPRQTTCDLCGNKFTNIGKSNKKFCSSLCQQICDKARRKEWVKNNPERTLVAQRKHYLKPETKAYRKEWRQRNPEKLRQYHNSPERKLYSNLRTTIGNRVRAKNMPTSETVNYTPIELRQHLESKFLPGMSWENYGKNGWHIDHIKPLCKFNFFDASGKVILSEVRKALSLDNLQPLWAADNIRKGGKYVESISQGV